MSATRTVIAATAGSGDLGNGEVTARVIGNNGTITFTSHTVGALGNGSGDSISYAQIATAVASNTSTAAARAPGARRRRPTTTVDPHPGRRAR